FCDQERSMKPGFRKVFVSLVLAVLSASFPWSSALADEAQKSAPASADEAKVEASKAGLTERERWLLDRVELLEKRVAELESKSRPASPALSGDTVTDAPETASARATASPVSPSAGSATALAAEPPSGITKEISATPATGETKQKKAEPFAFADFTWLNGNPRTKTVPLDTPFFTPEIRADVDYVYDFHHPKDDTIGGSSEVF